jgi:hypothetical protein
LEFIDAIEKHGSQVSGVFVHQVTQDLEPLSFPADMKQDPFLVLFRGASFDGLALDFRVHRQFLRIKPRHAPDLVVKVMRETQAAEIAPRRPPRDRIARERAGRRHERKIQHRRPQTMSADDGPDRLAFDVSSVHQSDVATVGRLETEKVHDAMVSWGSAGD